MTSPAAQEARQRALEAHYMARPPAYTATVAANALQGVRGLRAAADGDRVELRGRAGIVARGTASRGFVDLVFLHAADAEALRHVLDDRAADFGLALRMRGAKEARSMAEMAAASAAFAEMLQ